MSRPATELSDCGKATFDYASNAIFLKVWQLLCAYSCIIQSYQLVFVVNCSSPKASYSMNLNSVITTTCNHCFSNTYLTASLRDTKVFEHKL